MITKEFLNDLCFTERSDCWHHPRFHEMKFALENGVLKQIKGQRKFESQRELAKFVMRVCSDNVHGVTLERTFELQLANSDDEELKKAIRLVIDKMGFQFKMVEFRQTRFY